MKRAVAVAIVLVSASLPLGAQQGQNPNPVFRLGGSNNPKIAERANRPAPRLADGTIDLSGVWSGGGEVEIPRLLKPGELDTILQPWARKLMPTRTEDKDPYNYCMPGGPLRITGGFAWRFVQHPTLNSTHIFMLQEANAHTYRQIFMNAKHPADPDPSWYGHSIGRWEKDTLVIDTIGLHDKFWLDGSGIPHTEKLHLVERWTRTDYNTLRREVTIEDPGAYTRPFTVTYTARLAEPGSEILEYICIENNQYGLPGGITKPAANQ